MNYEQSNVGPGMVPHCAKCSCDECRIERLASQLESANRAVKIERGKVEKTDRENDRLTRGLAEAREAARVWENEAERRSRRYEKCAVELATMTEQRNAAEANLSRLQQRWDERPLSAGDKIERLRGRDAMHQRANTRLARENGRLRGLLRDLVEQKMDVWDKRVLAEVGGTADQPSAVPPGWRGVLARARTSLGAAGGVGTAGAANSEIEQRVGGPLLDFVQDELEAIESAVQPDAAPDVREKIERILTDFRLSRSCVDGAEDESYRLLDALTPPGQTIAAGREEIELLADHLAYELFGPGADGTADQQPTAQPEAALPQYCRQLSNYPPTDMMPCDCGETCAVAARGGTADQQPAPQPAAALVRIKRRMKELWETVPTRADPGSYYLGRSTGTADTLRAIQEEIDRAADQQPTSQPEVATCDACDRVRHQWQRECADTDSLLQTLGLCPSEYRSDGGSLLLGRISHKLASIAAAKPEAK